MGCFNILKHIRRKWRKSKSKSNQDSNDNENVPSSYRTSSRTRAFSTPLAGGDVTQQRATKLKETSMKEHRSPSPHPLPLPPSPYRRGISMKERRAQPLPLPYPPLKINRSNKSGEGTSVGSIRYFSYDEITSAIHDISSNRGVSQCLMSTIYKASFGDDSSSSKMLEATVNFLHPSTQDLRDFINEVNILASLQHPNLCKLLGFHAHHQSSEPRMLVYERLWHGSLDHLLFVKSDGPLIDWNMRMKIVIGAAQGLTFLHEEGPLQAMYSDFSAANIQIDKDFNAKLSGYGCVGHIPEEELLNNPTARRNLSKETLKKGMLTPKSNVWSFGIVLLELLTGRQNLDSHVPKEERNLVKWCRPFLVNDSGLSQIMDPELKCEFPPEEARTIAEIAQRCLQKEPSERPTMRAIVEHLNMIQESTRTMAWKPMSRSTMLPHHHHHYASSSNFSAAELKRQEST